MPLAVANQNNNTDENGKATFETLVGSYALTTTVPNVTFGTNVTVSNKESGKV